MSSSSSISRLYRLFSNNIPTPQILTKTLPKEENPPKPSTNHLTKKIFAEKNLTTLVKNFKTFSERSQFRRSNHVYEDTVKRLASAKKHSLIEQVLEHQKKFDDITKEGFAIKLITLYGKVGMFDHALKTYNELPELKCTRTVKSFNALLNASIKSKKFSETLKLFRELSSSLSVTPDDYSYNTVIHAYIELGNFDSAVLMMDEMEKNGVKPDLITFNTLLNGYYSKGQFSDGEFFWARMEESGVVPDIISFNTKLKGLVSGGNISEAVELVEQLGNSEVKPNRFTYNVLIKWYCSNGKLDEAKRLYDYMLKNDVVPGYITFEALIPCACEKGDWDLALKLCEVSLNSNCHISAGTVQFVIDGLVKESKIEEAKGLVEIAWSKTYFHSKLKMPQEDE
ncbi:hypothetical protein IFM89_038298 [Coptis chinensis]|uniref:Pentatricopeptide repeat-containing protein n=1 Tax=Coptis chinensis TaxID=261450 RepID=A0A835LKL5_9MAGN|nr:hypothetical protein IFM89_038298 [Coptis chinensis]